MRQGVYDKGQAREKIVANKNKLLAANVGDNFFVDETCINCDTCRQLAPDTFVENDDFSSVYRQPINSKELHAAYQALVACPVGSIGALQGDKRGMQAAITSFPIEIAPSIYYNGFNSEKSFGANSYFLQHPDGNWLIDSPRYSHHLQEAFRKMGGIKYIFLTHEDDVADAGRYAKHFDACRVIHRADAAAEPGAEWIVEGTEPVTVARDFQIIPVPGHTEGSMALLYAGGYLFTGDHMGWDREINGLRLATVYVWHEDSLRRSTERLLEYDFEWVLPGHAEQKHLPAALMKQELHRLLARRFAKQQVS
jgi:glyoxylase-like metal-dependent hydrolase (beta-lactamase superfamily II)/ferredoxin